MTKVLVDDPARRPSRQSHTRRQDTPQADEQRQKRDEPHLSLGEIVSWISFAAAIVAPFYILGILLLAAQIAKTYNLDFVTAWYAASAVSRFSVFGVSLEMLRTGWIYMYLATSYSYCWLGFINRHVYFEKDTSFGWNIPRFEWAAGRMKTEGELLLLSFPLLYLAYLSYSIYSYFRGKMDVVELVSVILWVLLFYPMVLAIGSQWHWQWRIVVILILIELQLGVFEIGKRGIGTPQLPNIEVGMDSSKRAQGQLLTHSDGYWYVLLHQPDRLAAIPDETAKAVISPPSPSPTPIPTATSVPLSTPAPTKTPQETMAPPYREDRREEQTRQ